MVLLTVTLTLSTLALQVIFGAIAAGLTGRAMTGGGYGMVVDLLFGIVGALVVNFIAANWNLLNISQYGTVGQIVLAIIGAVILVVVVHLFTARKSAA